MPSSILKPPPSTSLDYLLGLVHGLTQELGIVIARNPFHPHVVESEKRLGQAIVEYLDKMQSDLMSSFRECEWEEEWWLPLNINTIMADLTSKVGDMNATGEILKLYANWLQLRMIHPAQVSQKQQKAREFVHIMVAYLVEFAIFPLPLAAYHERTDCFMAALGHGCIMHIFLWEENPNIFPKPTIALRTSLEPFTVSSDSSGLYDTHHKVFARLINGLTFEGSRGEKMFANDRMICEAARSLHMRGQ